MQNEKYCTLNVLATFIVPTYETDFSSYLVEALSTGATVYLLLVSSPRVAANIIEQG